MVDRDVVAAKLADLPDRIARVQELTLRRR
jgi:hypothetical protein